MTRFSSLAIFAAAAVLSGCAVTPDSIIQTPATARPQPEQPVAPANGAIFQSVAYRPMFEDRRARLVGDIITVLINEKTSAGKSAANANSKTGSTDYKAGAMLGLSAGALAKAGVSTSTSNKFDEKGAESSSNNFSGTITATVVEVLPNGNLVVSGEKQISFDKGVEYVRFAGVVSPTTIGTGNIVSSTQIADARVEYRTNSRLDKAELMSQLARFFLSFAPL
jgi:flagellar L-ring protein precursor FlgH